MANYLSNAASYAAWQTADTAHKASVTANGATHATTLAAKKTEQGARVVCMKELGQLPLW